MPAQDQISIVMQVIDKATGVFDKIKASTNSVSDTLKANEQNFKNIGLISGAAFGTLSLVLGKSISEAKEAQAVNAQLEAVLKSTGGVVGLTSEQISGYASSLQKTTGIADDVIGAGQNMLLTFTNIGKDVFPKATETMLDMATAMNGGMTPSAEQLKGTSIQLGKALNDPVEGISALSRVGVTFTEQQKAQIAAMVKVGDTAGAQKLILAELGREFGGSAAAAAATFAGRMNILKETMNGVFEQIGNKLLPVLTRIVEYITPIVEMIGNWVSQNPELTATVLAIAAAVTGAIAALSALGLILPSIITAFGLISGSIATVLLPITAVVAGIALLGYAWKTNFLGIQDVTASVWEWIKTTFQAGIDWIMATIKPFLDQLSKFWSENGTQIIEGLGIFWEATKVIFAQIFDWIKLYVGTAWDVISAIFVVAFEVIKGTFQILFEALTGILTVGMQILNGDWSGAWETVKNTFSNIGATIVETGRNVFEKLYTTVTSIVARVETYVSGALTRIKDTLREIATLGAANTQTYNPETVTAGFKPAKAFGGTVRAGQEYNVGENGPERFIPASNGRIVSNRELASGGGGMVNNFDFSNMTVTSEADENRLIDKISYILGRQYKLALSNIK